MPFRTKDYLLFLLTVAFLVVGITSTAKNDHLNHKQKATVIAFEDSSGGEVIYKAVLPEEKSDGRASRLSLLKEKISSLIIQTVKEPEPEIAETKPTLTTETVTKANGIALCPSYQSINPIWSPSDLMFEVVEGARLVYRNVEDTPVVDELGQPVPSQTMKEVVLQLPLRTFPSQSKSCLSSDVVGIALDGSLIRNNEDSLYKVFGNETLIGYSLDGFPIYGLNLNLETDNCGGVMVEGEYRYYLSSDRQGVLGCYSGIPVTF